MRPSWVIVYGAPTRVFYGALDRAGAQATFGTSVAAHDLLRGVSPFRRETSLGSETGEQAAPSIQVELSNESGEATQLLANPPLTQRAEWWRMRPGLAGDEPFLEFAGVVQAVTLDAVATLSVVA